MKKNIVRIVILSGLILLCIWQTITLWLGDVSSHNFFVNNQGNSYKQYYVYPKQIWAINGYAYVVEGEKGEESRCHKLLTELLSQVKDENVLITGNLKIDYASLLSTKGLVYEYGQALSMSELTGHLFEINHKEIETKIKQIFVDLSASDNYRTYVYLIDENDVVAYMLTLNTKLPVHIETLEHFIAEEYQSLWSDMTSYQSSLLSVNDSGYFKNNVFYPLNDKEEAITYEQFVFAPIIIEGDERTLEGMVNYLFTNPIYKQMTVSDTEIVFYDNLNISVKYNKIGTLEFKKSNSEDRQKLTASQRMSRICDFIKEADAIPKGLKSGLYLSEIKRDNITGGTTYYFDYAYNNIDVILSQQIKEALNLEAYLELTIKNGEVISGKWLMMEPQVISNSSLGDLTVTCNEVTSRIYEGNLPEDNEKLEDLRCAYIFSSLDQVLDFNWVAKQNDSYYLYEKILGIIEI